MKNFFIFIFVTFLACFVTSCDNDDYNIDEDIIIINNSFNNKADSTSNNKNESNDTTKHSNATISFGVNDVTQG